MTQVPSPPTLSEVLSARLTNAPAAAHWSEADRALLSEDYISAAIGYAAAADPSPVERAKHGFCLGMQGDDDGAEALLDEANVGSHPEAQALLAWVLGGTWGRRMRGGLGNPSAAQRAATRRARVDALLAAALAAERPPRLAFSALFSVLGTYDEKAGPQAARARQLYPHWSWPHAIVAGKQRAAGELDPGILDDLMRTLPNAHHQDVFHEAYVYAMQLSRWGDAERVIETLERLVGRDTQVGDRNLASLAEMRAMLSLHRARDGETDDYESLLDQIAPFVPDVPYAADGRDPTVAPKFLLQVALETDQGDRVCDAATALVARVWDAHGDSGEDLDSWCPHIATPGLDGVLRFGHFGFDFAGRWREVDAYLSGTLRQRWRLLLAADAALHRDPEPEQVELLRETSPHGLPWWIGRAIYEAHLTHAEDPVMAGAVLAELAEHAAATPPHEDDRYPTLLESLNVDVDSLDEPAALFTGALAWLQATPAASGQALLSEWGAELAKVEGGKAVLSRLATLSLSRANSTIARAMKDLAELPDTPQSRLAAALARYPKPESSRLHPQDLTLLEAASLIALLRVSALDHVHWTVAPLANSGQRFEPTNKFIGTLFGLLQKGVLAIDASTPVDVVTVEDDGRLSAYLTRVTWRIAPNTLALQRTIRDLPHSQWPIAWRDHAPSLARDLGVEELVTYLEYLTMERDLPAPNMDEARVLFRMQLEHLSMAQCYYLAHKTMRETLDYKARYQPGRTRIEARIINLLRGNGERAIAQGWDTRYDRIRELPPSLLSDALHDVLTRWGRAAFIEPMMMLGLQDTGGPDDQH